MKKAFLTSILFLLSAGLSGAFDGFKSKEEAQAELDRMYGTGSEPEITAETGKRDEFNSISKFMDYVLSHPDEKVYIIYGNETQREAVDVLRTFVNRKRGLSVDMAEKDNPAIVLTEASKVDVAGFAACKSFILGSPASNRFIGKMAGKNKIQISGNKAQYRLFENPNSLAFACETDGMFTELVRIFIRSYADFDENCYSYFYLN